VPEDGQLLRDDRLLECKFVLEFLYRSPASHERFQYSDTRWVRQRAKELRFEALQLANRRFTVSPVTHLRHKIALYINIKILIFADVSGYQFAGSPTVAGD
jgi:hypothetical protein